MLTGTAQAPSCGAPPGSQPRVLFDQSVHSRAADHWTADHHAVCGGCPRRMQLQAARGPEPVVMLHVLGQDRLQTRAYPGSAANRQSRHSGRALEIQRSQRAFAFGARTGVRITSRPSALKTASNAAGKLLSQSWIRKRLDLRLLELPDQVPRLLDVSC